MKKTLLALGLAAAMMPFAFAQAPATNSGTTTTKKAKKTKKTKKNSGSTTNSATPSK